MFLCSNAEEAFNLLLENERWTARNSKFGAVRGPKDWRRVSNVAIHSPCISPA